MWKQRNRARRGNKGDIESVATTRAQAEYQVKDSGKAPTDCSRNKERTERKGIERSKRNVRGRVLDRKGVIKEQGRQEIQSYNQGPLPPTVSCL